MSSLNIGIIGMGVGEAHINGYLSHPACKIKTLCDFDPVRLKTVKEKYSEYRVTEKAIDVLEDPEIDVISIASFDKYHAEQIITGLRNGKHLFVEKPLSHLESEVKRILLEYKKHPNLKISSNLILRKSARFLLLKQMIQSGELGSISNIKGAYNYGRLHKITEGWRGEMDYYSGVCGGGVHIIDLMQWLLESKITCVSAVGNKVHSQQSKFKQHDLVNAILSFDNGVIGSFTSDMGCVHPHFHVLDIYGTKGTFINQPGDAILYTERTNSHPKLIETVYPGVHKGDLIFDFIESILNSSIPEVSREDIFHTMAVCFAIDKSAQQRTIQMVD